MTVATDSRATKAIDQVQNKAKTNGSAQEVRKDAIRHGERFELRTLLQGMSPEKQKMILRERTAFRVFSLKFESDIFYFATPSNICLS